MNSTVRALLGLTATLGVLLLAAAPAAAENNSGSRSQVLASGAGYQLPHGSPKVRTLQRRLGEAGIPPGPVDGLFGPRTEAAVIRFQEAQGLAVDGLAGPHTRAALRRSATALRPGTGYGAPHGSARVRRLQRALGRAGLNPGPVDGLFGPRTEAAVLRFQARHRLAQDGVAGAATFAALRHGSKATRRAAAAHPAKGPHNARPAGRPQSAHPARPSTPARSHGGNGSRIAIWILALGGLIALRFIAAALGADRSRRKRGEQDAVTTNEQPTGQRPETPPVLGYVPVKGVRDSEGQIATIRAECARRGLELAGIVRESDAPDEEELPLLQRPGLNYALDLIGEGLATGLIVADLRQVGDSPLEAGDLLEWCARTHTRLVSATPRLDTATERDQVNGRSSPM